MQAYSASLSMMGIGPPLWLHTWCGAPLPLEVGRSFPGGHGAMTQHRGGRNLIPSPASLL